VGAHSVGCMWVHVCGGVCGMKGVCGVCERMWDV
jgi:hypothetical protein